MDDATRQRLLEKNQRLIDMVIKRAKRDFPDDIALIGLTGSFSTGDFHEKSDLDLIIINNTPKGWDISRCFVLGDVGYDIYCTPWETRIEAEAALESPMVSHLLDLQILYWAKDEDLERFRAYQRRAQEELAKPIGPACIVRAGRSLDEAKKALADTLLTDEAGAVRYAAGGVLYHVLNAVVSLNNTYLRRGVKRYLEELRAYRYLPERFEERYWAVIRSCTVGELREAARALLAATLALRDAMVRELVPQPVPTQDTLRGTYEELWCNYRNKMLAATAAGDAHYAFHAALGAQGFLDEMTADLGTPRFDLMAAFDAGNLAPLRETFLRAMEDYRAEYDRVGRTVERYDTLEELEAAFLGR